jgi:DNA-binding MarR family transcriptional regulator
MKRQKETIPQPRWLDVDERTSWVTYLLATRLLWSRLERDMQRGAGMPLTYYEILSVLSEEPVRALRMADLAARLQVSPSRLSHAVSRLEEWGWLRRELCPSDRRGWIAVLTDEGMDAVRSAAPVHVESVRTHLFDQLTPEQMRQLRDISESLLAHLSPELESPEQIA